MTVFLFLDQIRFEFAKLSSYGIYFRIFMISCSCCFAARKCMSYYSSLRTNHMDKSYYSPLRTKRMQLSGEESNIRLPKASLSVNNDLINVS